jgi:hypothetical protein
MEEVTATGVEYRRTRPITICGSLLNIKEESNQATNGCSNTKITKKAIMNFGFLKVEIKSSALMFKVLVKVIKANKGTTRNSNGAILFPAR